MSKYLPKRFSALLLSLMLFVGTLMGYATVAQAAENAAMTLQLDDRTSFTLVAEAVEAPEVTQDAEETAKAEAKKAKEAAKAEEKAAKAKLKEEKKAAKAEAKKLKKLKEEEEEALEAEAKKAKEAAKAEAKKAKEAAKAETEAEAS